MLKEDFARFEVCMRKLEEIYGKKVSDSAMQAYWQALRDMPYQQVEERINTHIRYAKFFPKPLEIRPKEDRPKERDAASDGAFRDAERRADANLDELCATDRAEWLRVVSPKVYELGKAKGMLDGEIAQKLRDYQPKCAGNR